jgi:hypothetical protein
LLRLASTQGEAMVGGDLELIVEADETAAVRKTIVTRSDERVAPTASHTRCRPTKSTAVAR